MLREMLLALAEIIRLLGPSDHKVRIPPPLTLRWLHDLLAVRLNSKPKKKKEDSILDRMMQRFGMNRDD